MKTAVIIVGHGSRSGSGDFTLKSIAEKVRKNGRFKIVEYGYLQYSLPRVEAAFEECIRQDANKIVLVPFFLQPGRHVRQDIPSLIERAKKQYPSVEISATDFVGAHARIPEIVRELAEKTL